MVGPIKAPWSMKRMESNSAGKITVTEETPTVDLLPDPPAPEQPPLADCKVTEAFQDGGPGHSWSLFVNYQCSVCNQHHRIALDNITGPGNRVIQCECRESITLPLSFYRSNPIS